MAETYIPREREGKITIRIQTGYDQFGKPVTETKLADAHEIEELRKKATPFEIITEPEGSEDLNKEI